jgi:TonB family protein
VLPPQLRQATAPVYPASASGLRVELELGLTVDPTGRVIDASVLGRSPETAAPEFDMAALEAARALLFEPATRDGTATAARIRYRMVLVPPDLGVVIMAPEPAGQPAPLQPVVAAAPAAVSGEEKTADKMFGATGRARTLPAPPARAASDFFIPLGQLRSVPRANASDFLRLAPGIMLTNEGGEGHAERVYLRGFDAREGQDLEFTLDGMPMNEVGNPHGEGYADTHFILPEVVRAVRVTEGPFDPHQGNYAVAGSVDYLLGVEERGLAVSAQAGSFDTQRLVLTWAPEQARTGTFVGADVRRTAGFGQNRAAELGRALGQYELSLGAGRILRVLATSYATRFGSAGVVREDDLYAGRLGFFDTYDSTQGGSAQRHGLSLTYEEQHETWRLRQQAFISARDLRLRDNFTGFLEDPPAAYRSGSAQRGDMVDQAYAAVTVGARGSLRETRTLFGQEQSIELGYYARHDAIDASQRRLRFETVVPYRVDFDYTHAITNLALYVDAELRFTKFLSLRGGLRGDLFEFDTLDRCALHDTVLSSATPVVDTLCYERDRVGPRDPSSRRNAGGLIAQPRGTLIVGPFAGLRLVAALGRGARAADPSYLADGDRAPFSSITAAEGGAVWDHDAGAVNLNVRGLYYYTHVGQDLIFDQQEGRNTLAAGTLRQGFLVAARARGSFFDLSGSATYARARFEASNDISQSDYRPADAGDRVPYIPSWVARFDGALFKQVPGLHVLGQPLHARASLGVSYISPRALLFGEQGAAVFVTDAACAVAVGAVELGVVLQNLFDSQYRLSEYNYVSEFRQNAAAPNLLPVRHFAAGAPRSVLFTLTLRSGWAAP